MVWQAANLCQQTSHKSHVNKRQFSAKWHPWWGYCYNQRGWKGITGWLTNSCSFIWFWNLIKVAIVTHPVMAAADDQKNLFYLVIDMFVIGATTAHKTFHSILVKCHSNQPLSDWFSKGFKEAKAQQPFTKLITGRESAFFTTKSTLNPNSIQICTDK